MPIVLINGLVKKKRGKQTTSHAYTCSDIYRWWQEFAYALAIGQKRVVICRLLFTVAVDVVRGQFLFQFDIDEQFPFEFIVVVKLQKDLQNTHTYTTRSTSHCMFEHTGGS